MTPEERAEKLFQTFVDAWMDLYDTDRPKVVSLIAAEIRAAVEEAKADDFAAGK